MADEDIAPRAAEYKIENMEDRPASGMWHCGPNPTWVTVTHLPTLISARAYDESQHHARRTALACCEMMVAESRKKACAYPTRLHPTTDAKDQSDG